MLVCALAGRTLALAGINVTNQTVAFRRVGAGPCTARGLQHLTVSVAEEGRCLRLCGAMRQVRRGPAAGPPPPAVLLPMSADYLAINALVEEKPFSSFFETNDVGQFIPSYLSLSQPQPGYICFFSEYQRVESSDTVLHLAPVASPAHVGQTLSAIVSLGAPRLLGRAIAVGLVPEFVFFTFRDLGGWSRLSPPPPQVEVSGWVSPPLEAGFSFIFSA